MRYRRPDGGILEISALALRSILTERQLGPNAAEAGGVLLGRFIKNTPDVVVDEVTRPGPADRRSRYRFFRAAPPAQRAVDLAWSASGGTVVYLGEWHTHAEDDPKPSCVDRRDWKRIVRRARFEQDSLFFIIAGRVELRVWEVSRAKPVPDLLPLVDL